MKNILFVMISVLLGAPVCSQETGNVYGRLDVEFSIGKRKKISTRVGVKSAIPGWDSAWVLNLQNQLNQWKGINRRVKKGKYQVSIAAIRAKDGSVADVRCLKCPGYGMDQEVMRHIKKGPLGLPASSPTGRPVG